MRSILLSARANLASALANLASIRAWFFSRNSIVRSTFIACLHHDADLNSLVPGESEPPTLYCDTYEQKQQRGFASDRRAVTPHPALSPLRDRHPLPKGEGKKSRNSALSVT